MHKMICLFWEIVVTKTGSNGSSHCRFISFALNVTFLYTGKDNRSYFGLINHTETVLSTPMSIL